MATRRETTEEYREADAPVVAERESRVVTTDPHGENRMGAARLVQAVTLVFGVIIALVAIRFVLLALGANPDAGFTSFIYSVTGPLVRPFEGIFGAPDTGNTVIDVASLVAIVVYALISWVVARVLWLALGDTRTGVRTTTREVDSELR